MVKLGKGLMKKMLILALSVVIAMSMSMVAFGTVVYKYSPSGGDGNRVHGTYAIGTENYKCPKNSGYTGVVKFQPYTVVSDGYEVSEAVKDGILWDTSVASKRESITRSASIQQPYTHKLNMEKKDSGNYFLVISAEKTDGLDMYVTGVSMTLEK